MPVPGPAIASGLRLLRDRSGLAVMELCFVAPFLVLVACGIGDVAMGFARRLALQQAAARSIEMAQAAGLTNAMASVASAEAATAAGVPSNQITVTTWLECSGVVNTDITASCVSGSPARYISVRITDTYSSTFGSLLRTVGAGNWASVSMAGFATVRVQ